MGGSSDTEVQVGITADASGLIGTFDNAVSHVEHGSAEMAESINKVNEAFKLAAEIFGVGLSVEGIKHAIEAVTELDTKVQHLHDTFGISVGGLSDLNSAATLADSGLDDVVGTMTRLQRASAEAASGSKQYTEAFRALGISAGELKSLSPDELLERVAHSLTETAPSAERSANMMALFGRNIAGIYPVLQQLAEGAHETAESFGAMITPDQAQKSEQYSKSLADVKLAFQGISQTFVSQVLPALTQAANEFATLISTSSAIKTAITDAGIAAQFFADHLEGIVEAAKTISELALDIKIAGWAEALLTSAEAASGLSQKLLAVGSAATTGVALGAAAFSGWQLGTWARENFAWTAEIGTWIGAGIAHAQATVVAAFDAIWAAVKASFKAFVATLDEALAAPFQALSEKLANIAPGMSQSFHNIAQSIAPAQSATSLLAQGMAEVRAIGAQAAVTMQNVGSVMENVRFSGAAVDSMNEFKATVQQIDAATAHGKLSEDEYEEALQKLSSSYTKAKAAGMDSAQATQMYNQATALLGSSVENAAEALDSTFDPAAAKAKDTTAELNAELVKWQEQMDALAGITGGPFLEASNKFDATMLKLAQELVVMEGNGLDAATALKMLLSATDAVNAAMEKSVADDLAKNDLMDAYQEKLDNAVKSSAAFTDAQKAQAEFEAEAAKNMENLRDIAGQYYDTQEEVIASNNDLHDSFIANATGAMAAAQGYKNVQNAALELQNVVGGSLTNAFGAFNKDLIEGGNLMKDLQNVWKQTVQSILAYAEKLLIINPILNSMFNLNGTSGQLPTSSLGSLFGGGSGGGGSMFGGGPGGGGGVSSYINGWGSSALGIGANEGVMASGMGVLPAADELGMAPDYMAMAGDGAGATAATYGGEFGAQAGSSFLGTAIPVLSGVLAGWNEFNAAGGGVAGAAGGVAYGVGTASLAIGASAAVSGGLAVGLAAIPVVGWVAIGLMVLDKLTGGGLFGTAWKPTGNTASDVSIDSSGADINESYEEKKKKALFAGSKTKWKGIDDPDASSAVDDFFKQEQSGVTAFGKLFGDNAAKVASATFHAEYDKSGKLKSSTETVGGHTFTGETSEQFQQRAQGETYVEEMDKLGLAATAYTDKFIKDADKWAAAVQDMAGAAELAQQNLGNGFKFMALGASQTLVDVMKFVEGAQRAGETLQQTEQRLIQAQATYTQFIAQFAPAKSYVDPFEQAMSSLYAQEVAATNQANALAVAAGAASASQEDLTKITDAYTAKAEQLKVALAQSTQSMAFALGLTLQGSLDQVNQAIADLEGQATDATGSVSSFGDTMQHVSQQASDAMNLLLGNLSPLTDQQKLQTAMQGLRAGTVTQEQVLEIGRRLYASSDSYNELFKEVQGRGGSKSGGSGNGGGLGGTASNPAHVQLSPADQQKLADLKKERDTLQAAQTLSQFQTYAQQVEELVQAKNDGTSYQDILKAEGVDMKDLEKGLGLKSDEELDAYMTALSKQVDSDNNNTTSIVNAIDNLPLAIADALRNLTLQNRTYRPDDATGIAGRDAYIQPSRNLRT